jgi:hypothetical protein
MLYSNTIFSLLVQRKDTKEKTPCHLSGKAGYPVLLESARRCETRFAQTVLALFLADPAMLGCVKRDKKPGL